MGSDRTNNFKVQLQSELQAILGEGTKLSKEKAWMIFKACFISALDTTKKDPELRLPLAGLATFQIKMKTPRVPAGVVSPLKEAAGEKGLPYFSVVLSEPIKNAMIKELTGIDVVALGGHSESETESESSDTSVPPATPAEGGVE